MYWQILHNNSADAASGRQACGVWASADGEGSRNKMFSAGACLKLSPQLFQPGLQNPGRHIYAQCCRPERNSAHVIQIFISFETTESCLPQVEPKPVCGRALGQYGGVTELQDQVTTLLELCLLFQCVLRPVTTCGHRGRKNSAAQTCR